MQVVSKILVLGAVLAVAACGPKERGDEDIVVEPAVAAETVAAPTAPADPGYEVIRGDNPLLAVGGPPIDLFDIKLGASADEARSVLKAAAGKGYSHYTEPLEVLAGGARFPTAIIAEKTGGQEDRAGVLLVGPPATPQVWYVGRSVRYGPGEGPSVASTVKSLTDKYGPPHMTAGPQNNQLYWFWDKSGKPGVQTVRRECVSYNRVGAPYGDPPGNQAVMQNSSGARSLLTSDACARVIHATYQDMNGVVFELKVGASDNVIATQGSQNMAAFLKEREAGTNQAAVQKADGVKPDL